MILEGIAICSVLYLSVNAICLIKNKNNLDLIVYLHNYDEDGNMYFDINKYAPLYTNLTSHNDECSICLERLNKIKRKTLCGHIYCAECIENWFTKDKRCPLCNNEFSIN